ncbi:MAG: CBS domain-containing protein [Dehalococcoidia bacterium]|nr:CBS domain-containing protein [Dehalococcoidia bacterium]
MVKVRETMSTGVTTVPPSTPVVEIAKKMGNSNSRVVAVCDGKSFRGVVTESDIIRRVGSARGNPLDTPAEALIRKGPVVSPELDLLDAARAMVKSRVRFLPVAEHDQLVGLLTLDDLARHTPTLAAMVLIKIAEEEPQKTLWEESTS